jgi:hypothetical protein
VHQPCAAWGVTLPAGQLILGGLDLAQRRALARERQAAAA